MSSLAHVPPAVLQLADKLKLIHGDVRICREKAGWHIYLASPDCLLRDGRIELTKKHLAINAEKCLALGKYAKMRGTYSQDRVAQCMKTSRCYSIAELMRMPPLASRGIPSKGAARVAVNDTSRSLVRDAKGNMVPDSPGKTVKLSALPTNHPAIQYLSGRGYSIPLLEEQFNACFCYEEAPENGDMGRWYRKGPMGFRDTPQNRIIFYAYVNGVCKGWQARYLEQVYQGQRFILHPYTNQWVAVAMRDQKNKWQPLPGYDELDLSKYKTAFGARRNEFVMGFDAAVRWNIANRIAWPIGIIAEGPLDAGKLGPPAMASLGKSLSDNQAALLAGYFKRMIVVADNDEPGQKAKASTMETLVEQGIRNPISVVVPACYKDIGEMPGNEAMAMIGPHLWSTLAVPPIPTEEQLRKLKL